MEKLGVKETISSEEAKFSTPLVFMVSVSSLTKYQLLEGGSARLGRVKKLPEEICQGWPQ